MRLALFQPDIPQNTGTILRMAACFGMPVDVIGPPGFDMTDRALRRAGLDYIEHVDLTKHVSWHTYQEQRTGRLILLTTKAATNYLDFGYQDTDTLLLGRESSGAPPEVHSAADAAVAIPIQPPLRSLNIAVAAAIVTGEALRQLGPPHNVPLAVAPLPR